MNFKRQLAIHACLLLATGFFIFFGFSNHSALAQENCGQRLCNPLGGNTSTIGQLFNTILTSILQVGAVVAVCFVIYAGFLFVTASGEPAKITKAKDTLLYTAIGIAILFGAQAIVSIVTTTLTQVNNAAR